MANILRTWWEQIPTGNAVQRRQARFLQVGLVGWIALATVGLPINMFRGSGSAEPMPVEQLPPSFLLILSFLLLAALMLWLTPIIALVLLRSGRFGGAVKMAIIGLLIGHSIATFALGVADASVLVVYQIPIALAGLLGGRRMLLAVTGYCIGYPLLVAILQSQIPPLAGMFSAAALGADAGTLARPDLGQPVGFFIAVTILSALLLDRFGGALQGALSDSLQREAELEQIRESLEATVASRTAELEQALQEAQRRSTEQQGLLRELAEQRDMIRELSVPVLPVRRDTLVMPLVGALDSNRLIQIQEQALRQIEATRARHLLVDITGVPVVDSQVAQGLIRVVQAARLLGAQVSLVGIRPEVAQSIVDLGVELSAIQTHSDLQGALVNRR